MPAPLSAAVDVVELLGDLDDPLRAAAAVAARQEDAAVRLDILSRAVEQFGHRVTARSLQALARCTRESSARIDGARVERFLSIPTFGAQWLAATLLEQGGDHERAIATLRATHDVDWGEPRAVRLIALARNLIAAGRPAEAWDPLRHAARAATSPRTASAIVRAYAEAARASSPKTRVHRRVALIGTGTLQFWSDPLKTALFAAGISSDVFVGAFNQYHQEILDDGSTLKRFEPDVIVLAIDYRSLGLSDISTEPDAAVADAIAQIRGLWDACHARFAAEVVQFNLEIPAVDPLGRLSAATSGGRARILHRVNLALWEAAADANVAVFDLNEAAAAFGKLAWNDPALWIAAKQYPSTDATLFLARRIAALVRASAGLTSKCLVLDLDGTLWGGVVGEDGVSGIRLGGDAEGEAYVAFHRYLLGLKDRGIALAICSKNEERDARAVFREHPDTLLREDDFAAIVANWRPKPDNLRAIAAALNIGLDAMVVADDNPMERDLIRYELPEVEVPELPDDPALFVETLDRTYLFESFTLTDEDRGRAAGYRENIRRTQLAKSSVDVDAYLASLEMKVELRPFDDLNRPRVVQLINKTNQFNLTTRRASAADVSMWMRHPCCYTQFMRVRDRFGDNGITGVLVAFHEGDAVRIDNWLISCRVLGRRLENAMLRAVIDYARATAAHRLIGEYVPGEKNVQVADLFPRFGFRPIEGTRDGRRLFELSMDGAQMPRVDWFDVDDTTTTIASPGI
jgi:FkbH-like protein